MTDDEWMDFQRRRSTSPFRMRFHLSQKDKEYVRERGLNVIASHAEDFITKRLAPAHPVNDGRQTPMKGHPAFIAQHATGTCCRSCLRKWHGIPEGKELGKEEIDYIVSVIMHFIADEMLS